jgi:orsellinic acid C2-O-methyltransferase
LRQKTHVNVPGAIPNGRKCDIFDALHGTVTYIRFPARIQVKSQGVQVAEPQSATADDDASANARRLLEIVNASWTTQVTYVAASLGIADLLAARPRSGEELARATGAHAASLHRLMRALVTLDLCRQLDDGSYELTATGALLRADVEGSLRAWTLYWGGPLWSIWGNLLHSVKTGEPARTPASGGDLFGTLEKDPQAAADFNRAMVELTRLDAGAIVRACDFSALPRVVDVGGGNGELLAAILAANPPARGVLFDRPHAMQNARARMLEAAVADRCEFAVGDFFEAVPDGADAYVLKSVIHDWNDERAGAILANCHAAMHSRARLLLIERLVPPHLGASAAHRAVARADLNMLVGLGGRERTESEYRALLADAGFRVNSIHAAGPTFSIIEAVRISG